MGKFNIKNDWLEKHRRKHHSNSGITLVALVVTIIVLLILAGIAISLTIGNNGLFSRAGDAVEKHEEAEAREKLELALANIVYDKNIKPVDDEYIDRELEKEGMAVIGDVVIVNDWQFTIDRSVPKIGIGLGKGSQNEEIKIVSDVKVREDYVNATIKLDLTYTEGNIKEIIVNGDSKEVPEPVNGVYSLQDIVTENGIYTVLAKDEDGNYKIAKVEVTNITEDMEIWNKADMESFRDKVNSGRTFEGRTARVMDDIDLEGSDENQWIPIGESEAIPFKGTFEGNKHAIYNIYINKAEEYKGIFGNVNGGNIESVILESGTIRGTTSVAGIVAYAVESNITQCINKATIAGTYFTGGICGLAETTEISKSGNMGNIIGVHDVGGISGSISVEANISLSYNIGEIKTTTSGSNNNLYIAGGIVGYTNALVGETTSITNCYNRGSVYGYTNAGGIVGLHQSGGEHIVNNCYTVGEITGNGRYAISGSYSTWKGTPIVSMTNNYWLSGCGASYGRYNNSNTGTIPLIAEQLKESVEQLGAEYKKDIDNINDGYPILKWQIIR